MQNFEPVLITGFNRPNQLEKLIASLIDYNCKILVSLDTAKVGDSQNEELNNKCQEILEKNRSKIFDFQVAAENLGCFKGVTSGISWGFEQAESLIILEDDLEIDRKFLEFASWSLRKFGTSESIGSIAGTNLYSRRRNNEMARLSAYTSSWGWATWNDRWSDYLSDLERFPTELDFSGIKFEMSFAERLYWKRVFREVQEGEVDSWAYRWLYSNWKRGRFTLVANHNLVLNMGFGEMSTHTNDLAKPWWLPTEISMEFELESNFKLPQLGYEEDKWMRKFHFRVGFWQQIRNKLHNINPVIYLKIKNVFRSNSEY